jgi:polyhydroxybutyrate depolymerase
MSLVIGCGEDTSGSPDQVWFGGDRPVELRVPSTYDHSTPTPLLVVLHGFGADGRIQLAYTGLEQLIEDEGVLLAAPDGTINPDGVRFWNATPACCDGYGSGVDDVGYIGGLIEEISAVYNVDPDRVYLFGHSNGGYMSYRMACERADLIAGIVPLAGGATGSATPCNPSRPVSVLHIHGDADDTVFIDGGAGYPSASGGLDMWAGLDSCGTNTVSGDPIDIEKRIDGAETTVETWQGCPSGLGIELWTIQGGSHVPIFTDDFPAQMWAWLQNNPAR